MRDDVSFPVGDALTLDAPVEPGKVFDRVPLSLGLGNQGRVSGSDQVGDSIAIPCFDRELTQQRKRPVLSAHLEIELAPEARFETIPTLQNDFIAPAMAIVLPGVRRPIAFLDEIAVGPLAFTIQSPVTVERLLDIWSQRLTPDRAAQVLQWLWEAGVLRPRTRV